MNGKLLASHVSYSIHSCGLRLRLKPDWQDDRSSRPRADELANPVGAHHGTQHLWDLDAAIGVLMVF